VSDYADWIEWTLAAASIAAVLLLIYVDWRAYNNVRYKANYRYDTKLTEEDRKNNETLDDFLHKFDKAIEREKNG